MYRPSIVKSNPLEGVVTVNELALVAVPPGVVTEIVPVVAPAGTVVEMWPASVTEKVADVPLNFTAVAPVKFVPVNLTVASICPLIGEKLVSVGLAAVTVKLLAEIAAPCDVTSEILPVTAAVGTIKVTIVALLTENVAETPPTVTEVAPVKFVPVSVTEVPAAPLVGLKLAIVGDVFGGGVWVTLPLPQPVRRAAEITANRARPSGGNKPLPDSFFVVGKPVERPANIASTS
ncbi:MAG TPA: hypothetical protein VKD70_08155 [Candidatus Acidoferrum sp.]|nr:hypothetical protein [Candidatus Acidoferrum sp.]